MPEPRFKPCMQDQPMLLPPDIGDLVPEGSMPRVVDMVVRSIDRSTLTSLYPGGGAPAHDPQMMLKVVLLAYASGIYSSRAIARATRENVGFLWICGMRPLDHSTINRFRTERVRPVFEEVFSEVIQLLADMGLVTLDTYFLDGTKVEANANRFTFVWAKSTARYREQLRARVRAHLAAIDEMCDDEEEALAPEDPSEIDSEAIAEAARRINERIARKGVGRRPGDDEGRALRRAKRMLEGEWAERMARYEAQEETLAGRGSYSKTDPGATFMRMKEDSLTNQTKPGYNVQAGTEGQFILDVTCHQRPGDTACMIPHLEHAEETIGHLPAEIVADAGYGSEQNYAWLEGRGCDAYVKHGEFFRECRNARWRDDPMRPANWAYDAEGDAWACPGGRTLSFSRERRAVSELGHESVTRVYVGEGCPGCPLRKRCFRSKDPDAVRVLRVNPTLDAFRARASEMLRTERGTTLCRRRSVDVETIFGDIKRNWNFRRFLLRGLEKVDHEMRMVAMGHNIRKMAYALAV